MSIIFVVGARPNFVKMAPIYKCLNSKGKYDIKIIHTGQHYDVNMSSVFLEQFEIPEDIIYFLGVKGSPNTQIAEILIKMEQLNLKTDLMIVFGDVRSSLAASIFANQFGIKLAHIESGNRSFDKTMPEEINRIIIDQLSDYLFISEPNGEQNLLSEKIVTIEQKNINYFYVGNVIIDTLYSFINIAKNKNVCNNFDLTKNAYILLTLHRPSNVDTSLNDILSKLNELGKKYKILFPLHPRKLEQIKMVATNLILCEPQDYISFLSLMHDSALVITDSGGIQEETTVLGVPCITLRQNTERPITCTHGTNYLLTNINELFDKTEELYGKEKKNVSIDLWDGTASQRIVNIIDGMSIFNKRNIG